MPKSLIHAISNLRGRFSWLKHGTDWLPDLLRNQDSWIQKGLGKGLRFNGANSAVGFLLGTHDLEVQYAFYRLLRAGMVVYDVGANVGFTAVLAAKQVGPCGQVFCFEPLPSNAERIAINAGLNNFSFIHVQQMALGRSDEEAEFRISRSPTWGRLAKAGATPEQDSVIRVPVRSLDSLITLERLPPPHFIKIDVEGAEADVLIGGRKLLADARPLLVIELHHTFQAVKGALEGLNYTIRPLTKTGTVDSQDGEYQILALPQEFGDVEALFSDLISGNLDFL